MRNANDIYGITLNYVEDDMGALLKAIVAFNYLWPVFSRKWVFC